MQCPRCNDKLENIVEYITEDEDYIFTRQYYCSNCKSGLTEHFDKVGLFRSEWIDFNV